MNNVYDIIFNQRMNIVKFEFSKNLFTTMHHLKDFRMLDVAIIILMAFFFCYYHIETKFSDD
jgi:hypothetical protein